MKKLICAFSIFAALVLPGCVSTPRDLQLSESHPANPDGALGAYSTQTPYLMADTNLLVMKPASTNAPEHQHRHEAKPKSATLPKHEHP
jgi:hypothetical protein